MQRAVYDSLFLGFGVKHRGISFPTNHTHAIGVVSKSEEELCLCSVLAVVCSEMNGAVYLSPHVVFMLGDHCQTDKLTSDCHF